MDILGQYEKAFFLKIISRAQSHSPVFKADSMSDWVIRL